MKYEDIIRELVDMHARRGSESTHSALMATLGCCTWSLIEADEPEQPPADSEAIVVQTLLDALRSHINSRGVDSQGEAILNGLLKHDRWRKCLDSMATAYGFAMLATRAHTTLYEAGDEKSPLQRKNVGPFRLVMEEWLSLDAAEAANMSGSKFLSLIFGDAWCELMLPNDSYFAAEFLVLSTRPPFIPGLLPSRFEVKPQALPELDAP